MERPRPSWRAASAGDVLAAMRVIAAVGFDLVAGLARNQRRRHHVAAMAKRCRQPMEVVAQRSGLVGQMQLLPSLPFRVSSAST